MRRIVVLGASGLTGAVLIRHLSEQFPDDCILPIGRRLRSEWSRMANVRPIVVPKLEICDLSLLEGVDVMISTFGTTRQKAGSAERFIEIDSRIPQLWIGNARELGCSTLILLSSLGADKRGPGLYLQTKYDLEQAVLKMQFESTMILRPSLLLGPRSELRFVEGLAQFAMKRLSKLIPRAFRPVDPRQITFAVSDFLKARRLGLKLVENQELTRIEF